MEERPFIRNGKTLLSGIDPVRRAEKTAQAVSVSEKTLYFCPSPLYGYGLVTLLTRLKTEAPNSAVLCIEADPQLYEISEKNIPPSLFAGNKLRITNISDEAELCSFVRETWGTRTFRRIEVIRFSGGWQLFPEIYNSLYETLRREIAADWSNVLTLTKLGRLYIHNAIRNMALLPSFPSIKKLSFGEAPVLVLGAGPSLDETLDVLIKHFSSLQSTDNRPFKIICVDTCLGALKDRGIVPDLTVILESQHWNLRDFIGCKGWNATAAADLSSLPASAKILSGNGFLFFTPWTTLRFFERIKKTGLLPVVIPPLGSVGLSAVELGRRLTKGKIICAGLDFSFTLDKYHARGTPGHRSRLNTQTRLRGLNAAAYGEGVFSAASKSGLRVYSNPALTNYRNLFQQEFGPDTRIYDIEGSGLTLGVKTLSMNEAVDILKAGDGSINRGPVTASEDNVFFGCEGETKTGEEEKIKEKLLIFMDSEKKRLLELRGILTGEETAARERLSILIDECDYLWAHFPDYAGKDGQRPSLSDISFLKRVRAEIDPMVKLMERIIR